MARIRTIKPEFFRHEGLQDLEIAHPGKYPMMVFAALWGHCDKDGVFEWKPRTLKLDILPFLPFDMAETMVVLCDAGFVSKYVVGGKEYGIIQTFTEHQRINGKESQEPAKYPKPNKETSGKQHGSSSEATEKTGREGKGREQEGNISNHNWLEVASDADDMATVGKTIRPDCPHQKIIDLYHEVLPMCPRVRDWTPARATQLRARWNEDIARQNLGYWQGFFEYVSQSDFLCGRVAAKGGAKPFCVDLEWITKSGNFVKIREGKYHE